MEDALPAVRELTEQEIVELRTIDHQLAKYQRDLGALQFDIMQLQEKQAGLAKLIVYTGEQKMLRAREIAQTHGIDLNDASSGPWSLDIHASKVAFERAGAVVPS